MAFGTPAGSGRVAMIWGFALPVFLLIRRA
jgi:hypothetical protein